MHSLIVDAMENEELQHFFGLQRRRHVWGSSDGEWGMAMVEHFRKSANTSNLPAATTIPRILHLIWLGPRPLPNEHLLHSWRLHHFDWEIRMWNSDNIPSDLYNHEAFRYALEHRQYGMASDILRLEVLYKYGGVYTDMDYLCVAPLTPLEHLEFYCGASNVGCVEVNNGLLASRPHSGLLRLVMDDIHAWFEQHGRPMALISSFMGDAACCLLTDMDVCRHTGPGLWTRVLGGKMLQELPETIMIFPFTVFHPMPNAHRHLDLNEEQIIERYAITNTTKAIHLWHCLWQNTEDDDDIVE